MLKAVDDHLERVILLLYDVFYKMGFQPEGFSDNGFYAHREFLLLVGDWMFPMRFLLWERGLGKPRASEAEPHARAERSE
jgi:hypothetical protein